MLGYPIVNISLPSVRPGAKAVRIPSGPGDRKRHHRQQHCQRHTSRTADKQRTHKEHHHKEDKCSTRETQARTAKQCWRRMQHRSRPEVCLVRRLIDGVTIGTCLRLKKMNLSCSSNLGIHRARGGEGRRRTCLVRTWARHQIKFKSLSAMSGVWRRGYTDHR